MYLEAMSKYDFSSHQLVGDRVCSHCKSLVLTPASTPLGKDPEAWHSEARCLEGVEPIR